MNRNNKDGRGCRFNGNFNRYWRNDKRFNLNRRNDSNQNDNNRNNKNWSNYTRNNNYHNDNDRNDNKQRNRGSNRRDDDYYNGDRRNNNECLNDRNNFQRKSRSSFHNRTLKTQRSCSVPPLMINSNWANDDNCLSEDSYNHSINNKSKKRKRVFSPPRGTRNFKNGEHGSHSKLNRRIKRKNENQKNVETSDGEGESGSWDPLRDAEESNSEESNKLSAALSDIGPEEEVEDVQVEPLMNQTDFNCEEISLSNDLRCQAMTKLTVYHCIACHCINIASEDAMKHVKTEYHRVAFKSLLKKMTGIDNFMNHQELNHACKIVNLEENHNLPGNSQKKRIHFDFLADPYKNLSKS